MLKTLLPSMQMPPTLLLRLPQLPKQVEYRFPRNNPLLVDRENGLIVEFMTDILPKADVKLRPSPNASDDENAGPRLNSHALPLTKGNPCVF
jgi:hypothetical protein